MRPHQDVRDHGDHPGNRDHVPRDELAAGVARDQPVVDRDGREEEQIDDRMAEPPEDVLREQRVGLADPSDRLEDLVDEQPRERERGDDHVDADHCQRDDGIRHGLRVRRERSRHQVAPPERDPEPLADVVRDAVQRLAIRDRVQDREAPGHDRQPREQHREGEDAGRPVAPVPGAVERERVEEDPRSGEAHQEGGHDHAGDAEHHQPPGEPRHPEPEAADGEADAREDPVREPHHREPGPADEGAEPVRRHHRVPEVVMDACLGYCLAPAEDDPEQPGRREDDRRGDDVGDRQPARDREGAFVHHACRTLNEDCIRWWPAPQYSRHRT